MTAPHPDILGFQVSPSCTPTPPCSLGTTSRTALPDAFSAFHGPHPTQSSALNPQPPPTQPLPESAPSSNAQGVGPRRAVGVGVGPWGWGWGKGAAPPPPQRPPPGSLPGEVHHQPSSCALQSGIHGAERMSFRNTHLLLSPALTSEGSLWPSRTQGCLQPFWLTHPPLASKPCAL